MAQEYNFLLELAALRLRIHAEHNLEVRYVTPSHHNLVPLLTMFSTWKKKLSRETRLDMLSCWTENSIGSAYELTVYQVSTILSFLEWGPERELTARAKRFLADTQTAVESISGPAAIEEESDPFEGMELSQAGGRPILPLL